MKHFLRAFGLGVLFTSCLVQYPEYVKYDKVINWESGMSHNELQDSLEIKPFYVKEDALDGWKVYVYNTERVN